MPDMRNDQVTFPQGDDNVKQSLVDMANPSDVRAAHSCEPRGHHAASDEGGGFLHFDSPYHHGRHHEHHHHRRHHGHEHSDSHSALNLDLEHMSVDQLKDLASRVIETLQRDLAAAGGATANPVETPPTPVDTAPTPVDTKPTQVDTPPTPIDTTPTPIDTTPTPTDNTPLTTDNTHETSPTVTPISGTLDAVMAQNDKNLATVWSAGDSPSINSENKSGTERPAPPPPGVDGMTAWGTVTAEAGKTIDPNAKVQVQGMQTWVHLKAGGWQKIEDQTEPSNHSYIYNMTVNRDYTNGQEGVFENTGGVATIKAPQNPGQMDHFFIGSDTWAPGKFDPNLIDGVFVKGDIRATTNDSGMVAKLGGDWWTKATTADKALAGVPGQSNFTRLTDQWQPLYMTTLDRATLEKDPPPGISTDGSVVAGNPRPATDNHNATSSEPLKLIDIFPSSDNDWNQMIAKAPKDSIIVALHSSDSSWDNDMPFTGVTPELYNHIVASSNAGLKPLGYIGALEGNKPIETVKAEIDSWYQATDGHIAGIYFGNAGVGGLGRYATDAQHQAYFKEVADYIHSKGGFAAINAGGTPTDEVVRDFDMVGTYENYASQYEQSGSSANGYSNVSADHFAAELVGVSEQDIAKYGQMARDNHVGYLALTQDFNKSATDNDAYFSKVLDLVHGF